MTQQEQRKIFARNLRKCLEAKGISQVDLANMLDLSKTTVNSWVCEQSMPSYPKIRKIAEVLKVSSVELTDEYGIDYVLDTPKGRMLAEVQKQAKKMDERQLALLLQYIEVMNYTLNDKKE